ncbi:uncharacterized protein METZ01_LOCUS294450, partial [marine metagenome]
MARRNRRNLIAVRVVLKKFCSKVHSVTRPIGGRYHSIFGNNRLYPEMITP